MSPPLGPGDRLGPYRIVRRVGAGGMGAVHEAVDEGLGRSVAVKVIAPALAGDPGFRSRFTAEARALAALDSPHVVHVHAYGEIDGVLYLATQLVPDGDLARLVRDHGPLLTATAADLVAQVADGLAEAHRAGLLHRDIKPANVLLRDRGEGWSAYLADFGLARAAGAAEDGAGTPAYLAPEVTAGGPSSVASDVYAMGCLLRFALTGSPVGHPRAGREVDRVLARALAEDPGERYADVLALRDDLLAVERGSTGRRRTPLLAAAVIAAVVAVVVVVVATITGVVATDRHPRSPAEGVEGLAAGLRQSADLDRAEARCVATRLLAAGGDPASATDVFHATAECLWPPAREVTDG